MTEPVGTSQLSAHPGERVDYRGNYGPIAALRTRAGNPRGTVLLVPGYTGAKEDFAPILGPLAAHGLTAIAIDMPGQYESPGPDDEAAYAPLPLGAELAKLVVRIADEEPGPVLLLGHSYGGLVGRGIALAGAPIAGLTLLCSGPAAFVSGLRLDALRIAEPIFRTEGQAAAYAYREGVTQALRGAQEIVLSDYFRTRFLASSAAGLLGMARSLQVEPDRTEELAALDLPVLVVAGEADDAWPLDAQRRMAQELGTDLVLVPDAAHSPAVENPDGLLTVLLPVWDRWLG